jgi:hypothetical protein
MTRTYLLKPPRLAQKFLDNHSQRETSLTMTSPYFHVMSPRDDVYQALTFDFPYETKEPLIAAAGDAHAEEDHRLEKKTFSRFKFSALLLGFLFGFLLQFSILETDLLGIAFWNENLVTKSKTNIVVYSLFWSFFTVATVMASLRVLRKLVTLNYSAAGGCSEDLLEEIVLHMSFCFGVGIYVAWVLTGVLWDIPAQTEYDLAMLVTN